MPFEKGISGNPVGRPKGTTNKINLQLRETITDFLENNFKRVVNDFNKLTPKERVKFYCDLLQYGLPKLQAIELEPGYEKLSDYQIDEIVNRIIMKHETA